MECGSEASALLKLTLQHSKGSGRGRTAVRPYTPSPARGEGDYGVRKRSFRPAEADASALQRVGRAAPLAHSVGEGLGVRVKKRAHPAHNELKRCTLIRRARGTMECGSGASAYAEAALQHSKGLGARLPSPTPWERGWG